MLTGASTFVDATEQDGYIGAAGEATLAGSAGDVDTPLPAPGHVKSLRVKVAGSAAGVTVTLVKNGASTSLKCTTGAAGTCSATVATPIAFSAGDTIAVEVQHTTGPLHGVRWSTELRS